MPLSRGLWGDAPFGLPSKRWTVIARAHGRRRATLAPVKKRLTQLFEARRAALEAEAAVFDVEDERTLVPLLEEALNAARAEKKRSESSFQLQVLADVASQLSVRGGTYLLLKVLNEEDPSVRARAVQGLRRVAERGWAQFVRDAEQALADGLDGPALLELPGLLVDARPEDAPPPFELLMSLVDHEVPEVCAEALCACAEVGGPGVLELLQTMTGDERALEPVPMEPGDATGPATVGDLAQQLLDVYQLADDLPEA